MKQLGAIVIGLVLAFSGFADDLVVQINVMQMLVDKSDKKNGDRLYFDIAEYRQGELQQFYRIPKKPVHFLSQAIEKVKDVTLWRGTVKEGQAVDLAISLIEEDFPPWNLDDLIGVIKVKLQNNAGKLTTDWRMPNKGQLISSRLAEQVRFRLTGSGADYKVDLQLMS